MTRRNENKFWKRRSKFSTESFAAFDCRRIGCRRGDGHGAMPPTQAPAPTAIRAESAGVAAAFFTPQRE
jgi:hypothetical protein